MSIKIEPTTIELLPAEDDQSIRISYMTNSWEWKRVEWFNEDESIGYLVELVTDREENFAWVVYSSNRCIGYFSPHLIAEEGGWHRILANGASLLGYSYVTVPDEALYLVSWTGGYEAPQFDIRADLDEALALAAEWRDDANPETNTIDVYAIDSKAATIKEVSA